MVRRSIQDPRHELVLRWGGDMLSRLGVYRARVSNTRESRPRRHISDKDDILRVPEAFRLPFRQY